MHVVLIGWVYVVAMIAVVSDSWITGLIRFLLLGALPLGLWAWFSLQKRRRRAQEANVERDLAQREQPPES